MLDIYEILDRRKVGIYLAEKLYNKTPTGKYFFSVDVHECPDKS